MTIEYNNKNHLQLAQEALNFKKQKKKLFIQDSKASGELIYYQIYLQDYIFWTKKSEFVSLMENLITFEQFETQFSVLWSDIMKEFHSIKLDLEKLKNFEPNPESANCGSYITCVYRIFEELEDEVCTEQEARDSTKYTKDYCSLTSWGF
jgi:hypothetical protein